MASISATGVPSLREVSRDIGGAVNRGEVAPPAKEADVRGNSQIACVGLELVAKLAVAGNQRDGRRPLGGHLLDDVEKQFVLLDRREPADGADDGGPDRQIEFRARLMASRRVHCRERRQIESQRYDPVLALDADAMGMQQFLANGRRDGDDRVADRRQGAFQRDEHRGHQRAEVAVEHVTVVGVNHPRARRRSAREVVGRRRQASKQAGLGHVGMHDRRLGPSVFPVQAHERAQVVEGRERTAQCGQVTGVGSGRHQVRHVAFAGSKPSMDQASVEPATLQGGRQASGLDRRSADIEPRDDTGDTNRGLSRGVTGHRLECDHFTIR